MHTKLVLLLLLVTLALLYSLITNRTPQSTPPTHHLNFQSIPGFFVQDHPNKHPSQFQVVSLYLSTPLSRQGNSLLSLLSKYHPNSSFGLLDNRSPDRWIHFKESIALLTNRYHGVNYKVIFIVRHGQGFHNVAESKYGTILWDCYWSEKKTDGELVWGPDSRLTDRGKSEAKVAHYAWLRELENHAPFPQLFISSPLSRAIETMFITGLFDSTKYRNEKSRAIIKEDWRENIGLHTCDQRRTKQEISEDFQKVEFEDGFTEPDLLWTKDLQETEKQLEIRIKKALTSLFLDPISSELTYISITAHSGVISALLKVVGHQPWPTQTGGMIPLVIRATPNKTPTRPPSPGPSATQPKCPSSVSSSI